MSLGLNTEVVMDRVSDKELDSFLRYGSESTVNSFVTALLERILYHEENSRRDLELADKIIKLSEEDEISGAGIYLVCIRDKKEIEEKVKKGLNL